MRLSVLFVAAGLLAGCGDDGSGAGGENAGGASDGAGGSEGGASAGGAPVGGAAAGSLSLDIAANEAATVTCATFVDGVWATGETDFDENGEVSNLDCALVAVNVSGEATPFWITSRTFEGIFGSIFDLRHSFSTAEAVIAVDDESLELLDVEFNAVFTGTVETLSVSATAVEIEIAAE